MSFIISMYFSSYFLTLSTFSAKAFVMNSSVMTFDFAIFAQVAASPTITDKSVKRVESLCWSSASLEAYSINLAIAPASRGGKPSCEQYPFTNLAKPTMFSSFKTASSANSTFILNNFLKSGSIASKV